MEETPERSVFKRSLHLFEPAVPMIWRSLNAWNSLKMKERHSRLLQMAKVKMYVTACSMLRDSRVYEIEKVRVRKIKPKSRAHIFAGLLLTRHLHCIRDWNRQKLMYPVIKVPSICCKILWSFYERTQNWVLFHTNWLNLTRFMTLYDRTITIKNALSLVKVNFSVGLSLL